MKTIQFAGTDNLDGLVDLVQNLPVSFGGGEDYQIRFPPGYLYSCPFPVIATWSKRLPDGARVTLDLTQCQESARRLVDNVGLTAIVENDFESPRRVVRGVSNVPLQPIVVGRSTDEILDRVHRMIDDSAQSTEPSALRTMLSELAENILAHSEAASPGYVHARVHKSSQGEKCEITFADSGIGILSSYLEGTNDDVKSRIQNGASALQIALDGLIEDRKR